MTGATLRDIVFLFSDIEGSTKLWEQHPEEMRSALELHDSIAGAAIEATGGELVKSTGDGVMAVFGNAESAISTAISMQQDLADADWGVVGAIQIRVGIHQGESQVREGDYFGPVVNRTARLMSAGHGGQILVSAAVAGEIGDNVTEAAAIRDLGRHRLKDLAEPEHIFQVVASGLPESFPPLSTLDVTPNNLPTQTSSFLGRARELDAIRELIERSETRLITLVGPGGTGKTRLGLQAGAEQVDRFPEGIFFIDLSTETDPDESFASIARVVGIDSASDETALEALKRGLAQRATLLILDNLEQIQAIGLGIDDLLGASADLKVLATSREPLRVRSEHLYAVDPLSLPTTGPGGTSLDDVLESESARLLAERAAQQVPGFTIDESNARTVASICIQLDGLPLALELAAARLRMFSLTELDERLGRQIDVLKSGAHDLPARQRTLRATIEWSYELLTETERSLLLLLSVFAGATVGDLEVVADAIEAPGDALDDLSSLVDKSLVRKTESPAGVSRFSLLQTIRSYASERSAADPEQRDRWRRAHGEHFADMAAELADSLGGADRRRARQRLADDVENLQVAWAFWVNAGDLDRVHQLFDPMWMLYDAEGWYQGAILLAEDLLAVLAEQPESEERTSEQIALETSLARARMLVRGYTESGELAFLDALEHAKTAGSAPQRFPVLRSLATFYTLRGEMDKAIEVGKQLMAIAEEADNPALVVDANLVYGVNTAFSTTLEQGQPYVETAVEAFDSSELPSERFRLGPHAGIVSMTTSAFLLAMRGFAEQAVVRAEEALVKADELGHSYSKAYAMYHVAYFKLIITGDMEAVARHGSDLLALANQYDYQIWRALALVLQGVVQAFTSDPAKGMAVIEQGIEIYQRLPTPPVFWAPLLQLRAPVAAMTGDMDRALDLIDEAVAIETGRGSGLGTEILVTQGDLLLMAGRPDDALESFRSALEFADKFESLASQLRALTRLTQLERDPWIERLAEVYKEFTEGFDLPDMVAARTAMGID